MNTATGRTLNEGACYKVFHSGVGDICDILLVKEVSEDADAVTYDGVMMLTGEKQSLIFDKVTKEGFPNLIGRRFTVGGQSYRDCVNVSEALSTKEVLAFMLEKQSALDAQAFEKMNLASKCRVNCMIFAQEVQALALA